MTFNFQGVDTDFRDIFYTYIYDREGYRTDVYKDIYGNDTVGIGHLVVPADNLSYKDTISHDQVKQYFYEDYDRLGIDKYVQEAAQNYNQGLGIGHFLWRHGSGSYPNSELRQHVINKDLDLNGMIDYLNAHWDIGKPSNQKDNKYDFTVFYSDTPWLPAKSVDFYISQIKSFASTNPIATYGIAVGLAMSAGFLIWGGVKLIRNFKKK